MESTTSLDGSGLEKTPANLTSNTISTMLLALTTSYRRSQNRSHKELVTFALSILLLLGLIGGSFWVPVSALNPIFVLITVFISWLATTMLYEGFIFGNWELKALLNVIEELELYQKQLDGQTRTPSNYSRW